MGLLGPFPTQPCNSAKRFKLLGVVEFQTVKAFNPCVLDTCIDLRILLPEIHSTYRFKDREGIQATFIVKKIKGKK